MKRELYDLLIAVRTALEREALVTDAPSVVQCPRCNRNRASDEEFIEWGQWLHKMGWQGETEYDISWRGWLVAAWREERVVGPLYVPDRGGTTGCPTLADAYREVLDRIERGAVVEAVPGAIMECETGWWQPESREVPSCAPS